MSLLWSTTTSPRHTFARVVVLDLFKPSKVVVLSSTANASTNSFGVKVSEANKCQPRQNTTSKPYLTFRLRFDLSYGAGIDGSRVRRHTFCSAEHLPGSCL